MSYKVLSRKWRPENFDEIIGQEHVSHTLKNAIKQNRVAHGFLFFGPRGVGKTTTARIFAKALNCAKLIKFNPCNSCNNCVDITSGRNLDVLEIDGASNRGIEEIRELREAVKYPPISGNYRVYIIDEIHMLTQQAFNALLKTLEEPPGHVKFIMATTEPHKIPQTILSRTLRFNFHKITSNLIDKQIISILNKENLSFDNEALHLISDKADGSMRDALSYLDQIIAYTENKINIKSVREILGIIEENMYIKLYNYCISGETQNVLQITNKVLKQGYSIQDFIIGWNEYLRKIILYLSGEEDLAMLSEQSIEIILNKKNKFNHLDHLRMLEISLKFESRMNKTQQMQIAFEAMLLKLCAMDSSVLISDLIDSVKKDTVVNNKDILPLPKKNESNDIINEIKPEILKNNPVNLNLEMLKKVWKDVISKIEEINPKLHAFIEDAIPRKLDNKILLIELPEGNEFQVKSLQKDKDKIQDIFSQLINYKIKIEFKSIEKVKKANNNKEQSTKKNNHPLIMDAMEMFDGKLIK